MSPLAARLAAAVAGWARAHGPGLVVGVSGPQGCGKTTACAEAVVLLEAAGLRVAVLALDDLYLPRAERERLARQRHPLWRTRGSPGTHDAELGAAILDELRAGRPASAPVFSKPDDDRALAPRRLVGPYDVVLFEGWCVGVRPEPPERLVAPFNVLERDEDADGRWRAGVNAGLAGEYAHLWRRLDRRVVLTAPDWPTVCGWREQAEAVQRADSGRGMAPAELERFLQHYERLTRWAAQDLPARADLHLALGADRAPP